MDPITVGVVATAALFVVVISLIAFKLFAKETDFEEAYGASALRLLTEEKGSKPKGAKPSKSKTKSTEKKKDSTSGDKDLKHEKKPEEVVPIQETVIIEQPKQAEIPAEGKHRKKKPKHTEDTKPSEAAEPEKENKAPEVIDDLNGFEAPLQIDEPMGQTDAPFEEFMSVEGSEKKARKRKARRADDAKEHAVKEHSPKEQPHIVKEQFSKEPSPKESSPLKEPIVKEASPKPAAKETAVPQKERHSKGAQHPADDATPPAKEQLVKQFVAQTMAEALESSSVPAPVVPAPKGEKEKEKSKPKKQAVVLSKDLTVDKLHTRLSAIDELEPEYLSFLATYFSDTGAQKTKLAEEVAALRKQIFEKDRTVAQITEKLNAAQKREGEITQLQTTLGEEKKKYTLFEQSVCTQLNTSVQEKKYLQRVQDQLKSEIASLKEDLKKAQATVQSIPPPVDTTAFQQQADMLKAELNSKNGVISKLEAELGQRSQALENAEKEIKARDLQLEQLTQASAASEKHVRDVEATAKAEHELMEAEVKNATKAMTEVEELVSKLQNEIANRTNSHLTELDTLNHQLSIVERERNDLKKECYNVCAKFSEADAEHIKALDKLRAQILAMEKENAANKADICSRMSKENEELLAVQSRLSASLEETRGYADKAAAYENDIKALRKQRAIDEQTIADLDREVGNLKETLECALVAKSEEIRKLRDEVVELRSIPPAITLSDGSIAVEVEERMENVKEMPLQSAAPAAAEIEALKREIEDQKRRNNELREANYKVVELSRKQDEMTAERLAEMEMEYGQALQDCISETARVLSETFASTIKIPPARVPADAEQYRHWIGQVCSAVRSAAPPKPTTSAPPATKVEKVVDEKAVAKVKELEEVVERYRTALAAVSSSMEVIEREAAQKEKAHAHEIGKLKKEIDQQVGELKRQLADERKSGRGLSEQASQQLLGIPWGGQDNRGGVKATLTDSCEYVSIQASSTPPPPPPPPLQMKKKTGTVNEKKSGDEEEPEAKADSGHRSAEEEWEVVE